MLYEAPPYYLINGVSIVSDHAGDGYYYMPLGPRFVTRRDGELDVPRFSLLDYQGQGKSGGFADFDVHLGLSEEELTDIRQQLMRLAGLSRPPSLNPIPVVDGSVKLMLFGVTSSDTPGAVRPPGASPPAEPAGGSAFVRKICAAAKPALFNTNRAAFSVELDADGVTLLDQAMKGEMSPIGVVYSLDYLALRPAYHIKLHVAWDRVQDLLDETFGHESLFTDIQIQNTVDKLVEDRAIVFEADTFVPEDEGGTLIERRDAALARVRDMIRDSFFESSLGPLRQTPDGWDKAAGIVKSFAPQRFSPFGVFSYKKTHYTRIDDKRLDVDFSERTTVKRTIYPQGHLGGLFRLLGQGLEPARLITRVNLDHPWFKRRKVVVQSLADFAKDPVQSIQAFVSYGGETRSVELDAENPTREVEWTSSPRDGAPLEPVLLRFDVTLPPVDGAERPHRLSSPPSEVTGEKAQVQPRDLFSTETIVVATADKFPFDRYPAVHVQMAYDDPEHGIRQSDLLRLAQGSSTTSWERFLVGGPRGPVLHKIFFRAADGRDRETPWAPVERGNVYISDPFPRRLRLDIQSALNFARVDRAFVDLQYDDAKNGIHVEDALELSSEVKSRTFIVDREDPQHSRVRYKLTLLMKDTTLFEGPWSTTLSNRIFVREDLKGHRAVTLRAPADFAAKGLVRLVVQARANDADAGLVFEDGFEFAAPGAAATFEFDFADPSKDAYELQIKRVFKNGMSTTRDWQRFDQDELTLSAAG